MKLGPHTIEVVEPKLKSSAYGNTQVLDWSDTTSKTIEGCSVQPGEAPEFTQDRSSTMQRWVAYLPITIDVSAEARVIFEGDTYDIDGEPQRWFFGQLAHQVINLRRSQDEAV